VAATQEADVAVIGAGIIGLSCAYELASQGAGQVVVFDKGGPVSGTTGGSAGVICPVDLGDPYIVMGLLGYARVLELAAEHGLGFAQRGLLRLVYAPDDPAIDRCGLDERFGGADPRSMHHAQVLDIDRVLEILPWVKKCSDTAIVRTLRGGRFYPNQGFVNAYELVRVYERLALGTGKVSVNWLTPVLRVEVANGAVSSLITRRGTWRVGQVLNAGGPWGAKVADMAGTSVPLTPQRIQVCVARAPGDYPIAPLTGVPDTLDGESVWCRGEEGGMLLFGQHHHFTKSGASADPDFVNRENDASYPADVANLYSPWWSLSPTEFMNGWCCVYGTTTDGYPIVARDTAVANLFHALGMNGHGITVHAAIALSVCQLMLRDTTKLDVTRKLGQTGQLRMPLSLDLSRFDVRRFEAVA
jgi:sarcosine oxidase, subunit beta